MKKGIVLTLIPAIALAFALLVLPTAAQENLPSDNQRTIPDEKSTVAVPDYLKPEWGGSWQYGPDTDFAFTRFDGEYYPGDGLVYFMGGRLASGTPDTDGSVWSFNSATGIYLDTGTDILTPISNYQMNLLQDGSGNWGFYVFCGRPAGGGVTDAVQVYYPDTNTVDQLPPADDYPGSGSCTSGLNAVYNNKAYVAGGFDPAEVPYNWDETWVFDPTQPSGSRWTQISSASLTTARAYIMSAVVDDMIYAIGGNWFDGATLTNVAIVEVMDPNDASPTWDDASVADLPEDCSSSRAWGFETGAFYQDPDGTPLGGKIVSGCGFWSDENNKVFVYDTFLDFWEDFPYLDTDRRDHAAAMIPQPAGTLVNGIPGLWVWGGRKDSDTNVLVSSEYYDLVYDSGECTVLLVDDDWDFTSPNGGGRPYYTSTLDYLGYPYDLWDTVSMGTPTAGDMAPYDAVVWFTGYDWADPISPTTEGPELSAYMDAGGSVFMSSQEQNYAYGLTPIMTDYFWVDSVLDDVILLGIEGNASDPLFSSVGPSSMGRPDAWDLYWPTDEFEGPYDDEVFVKPGGTEPMVYTDTLTSNSTRFEGVGFKSVYLGYPFEWLVDVNDRADVLGTALEWFCQPTAGDMNLIPPGQVGGGVAGTTVPYTLTIVNDIGWDETFTMTYSATWPISGPTTVGPIPDGGTEDLLVNVDIPADLNCYVSNIAEVMAVAQSTPVISDTAYIETEVLPGGNGNVAGHVLDANTGLGIENAYVYVEVGDEDAEIWTSADGSYQFSNVFACGWEGQFEAFGYYGKSGISIDVTVGSTTTLDISLDASWPDLSDTSVSVDIPEGMTDTFTLSLSNSGTGDLTYHVSEVPVDAIYPITPLSDPMPNGIDPQVHEDIAASLDGSADFIVYLAEQADLSAAYSISDWNARGQYVLDALKGTAERTQANLKAYLANTGVPFESRYIVNALVVQGDNQILSDIASRPEVAFIGPNTAVEAPEPVEMSPTLDGIDTVVWNIEQVRADEVWTDFGATGTGVVVSNIDTGVLYTHTVLVDQYRGTGAGGSFDHNYNWWDPYGYGPTEPYDFHSHGSHTMGTMLGDDGGTNQTGMAPDATWMACQGFDQNTGYGYNVELLECAEFVLAPWDLNGANPMPSLRPHVVNNSWGGGQAQWWYNQAVYAWRAAGIFGVFSAGNEGPSCETSGDPGDLANMMAVGATDDQDMIASFSSRGPAKITGILKPNVSAPGVSVVSAYNNGAIGTMSGTSMASPHVAGEAALLWSAEPALIGDVDQTYWIIEQTAKPLTTTQGCGGDLPDDIPNNVYGWGRIDAYEAVSLTLSANWDIPWLSVNPEGGEVMQGGSTDVELSFDTTGLMLDACYSGTLMFDFNDPYVTEALVPVEVCIVEQTYPIYLPITFKE